MAFTAKTLADGQLADSEAAIYTVPENTKTYVRFLSLYNVSGSEQTITLWIRRNGGSSRKWRRFVLNENEQADALGSAVLMLSAGDSIRAASTNASSVDYVISGVEET